MVSWDEDGERIAVCSHTRIASYEATKMSEPVVVHSSNFIGSGKLLCCKWHPEGVLFFGGLFDCIFGVSLVGEIVRTIQPFPRTRDIIF